MEVVLLRSFVRCIYSNIRYIYMLLLYIRYIQHILLRSLLILTYIYRKICLLLNLLKNKINVILMERFLFLRRILTTSSLKVSKLLVHLAQLPCHLAKLALFKAR